MCIESLKFWDWERREYEGDKDSFEIKRFNKSFGPGWATWALKTPIQKCHDSSYNSFELGNSVEYSHVFFVHTLKYKKEKVQIVHR